MTDEKLLEILERDKPKKPIEIQDKQFGDFTTCCPNCKKPIVNVWSIAEYKPNGCHYCLQRFDWK